MKECDNSKIHSVKWHIFPFQKPQVSMVLICVSAPGNIKSMKNLNDPIVNRTRYLPACSAVPLRIQVSLKYERNNKCFHGEVCKFMIVSR